MRMILRTARSMLLQDVYACMLVGLCWQTSVLCQSGWRHR